MASFSWSRVRQPDRSVLSLRYEDLAAQPQQVAAKVSEYLDAPISRTVLSGLVKSGTRTADEHGVGSWRERLSPRQAAQVEKVAGTELQRLGYRLAADG